MIQSSRSTVAGVLAVAALTLSGCGGDAKPDAETGPPVTAKVGDTWRLSARAQSLVGGSVNIDSIEMATAGYLVVFSDSEGTPGTKLAVSKLLAKGRQRDVRIDLSDVSPLPERVFVVVHGEDNGNRTFDYPSGDQPISDDSGVLLVRIPVSPK